jgi:hypothetical protein
MVICGSGPSPKPLKSPALAPIPAMLPPMNNEQLNAILELVRRWPREAVEMSALIEEQDSSPSD